MMTLMLAPNSVEIATSASASWVSFAKTYIWQHIASKGIPIGDPKTDNNLLFIGETSSDIHYMSGMHRTFSVLPFLTNPFQAMSEQVLLNVETLYAVNSEHAFMIKNALHERFGGMRQFRVVEWKQYPKPFEPPTRKRKLIGVMEPDFNGGNIFGALHAALESAVASPLHSLDFDVAFYAYSHEVYDYMIAKGGKYVPVYLLDSAQSPVNDLTLMPDAVMSLDTYQYNPILSAWGQVIPVLRPDWVSPGNIDRVASSLSAPINGASTASSLLHDYVNAVVKLDELEISPRLQDTLAREVMLGDLYGDYSKFRRISRGA
ncbi:hypothetical protein [Rhizobium phage RHph_N46]|nr:hypothetical protein [Rhizobium phage RHph_N46]